MPQNLAAILVANSSNSKDDEMNCWQKFWFFQYMLAKNDYSSLNYSLMIDTLSINDLCVLPPFLSVPGWPFLAKITIPFDFPCQFCVEFIYYTPTWAFWIRSYNSQFPQYCTKRDRWPSKIGHSVLLEKKVMWLTWRFRKPKDNIRWSKNIFYCRARSCPQPWKSLENGHFLHHFFVVILTIPIDPHVNFVWNSWITHFSRPSSRSEVIRLPLYHPKCARWPSQIGHSGWL